MLCYVIINNSIISFFIVIIMCWHCRRHRRSLHYPKLLLWSPVVSGREIYFYLITRIYLQRLVYFGRINLHTLWCDYDACSSCSILGCGCQGVLWLWRDWMIKQWIVGYLRCRPLSLVTMSYFGAILEVGAAMSVRFGGLRYHIYYIYYYY